MVEQVGLASSRDTHGHNGHPFHIWSKHQACFQIPGEVEPAVPEAAGAAPAAWEHGTVWKKSKKFAGAAETKARLMIDRPPARQPVLSEYEGG